MKIHWKLFLIVMFIVSTFVASTVFAQGMTIYVDDDAPSGGDGSAANPFNMIQPAINLATSGDTVLVDEGVYSGLGNKNLELSGKAITVRSVNGAGLTVIDCQGSGRGFYLHSGEGNDTVIDGFKITGGYVDNGGGGILCVGSSSPTIRNCIVSDNEAPFGAGGGIGVGTPGGGGSEGGDVKIINCLIARNTAWFGGGLYSNGSSLEIVNCTFHGNNVSCLSFEPYFSFCGGAIYCMQSLLDIKNSILWGNSPEQIDNEGSNVSVTYSDVQGGYPGSGNKNTDPFFVNSAAGDYDLSCITAGQAADSPCANQGDPSSAQEILNILSGKTTRTDGEIDSGVVDMGFHYDLVAVSITKGGTGSGTVSGDEINCGSDCSGDYSQGLAGLTLSAVANAGSDFTGWSGGGCTTGDCVVSLDRNITVNAKFDINSSNPDDSDNDALLDWLEYSGCTDPYNPDTDGDGIMDGNEDADHNGSVDAGETDPCNPDTDGDGMYDGWEVQYGLNPLNDDGGLDTDTDGLTNYEEFSLMSDPTNPNDPSACNFYEYDELGRIKRIIRNQ